ncbi:hypothetical protein V8E52_011310 [Russula decolorans]
MPVSSTTEIFTLPANAASRAGKSIVDEVTTLCRHLEAHHSYRNWAKTVNFTSKLPGDIKKRKEAAELATRMLNQDLVEKKSLAHVAPYSNKLFCQASVEWLVATDQPIQALQHPKFQEMINVASRATKYMTIPGQKATRAKIMRMFKDHLCGLKAQLNGQTVTGEISLTCDAWQASNTDGYFPVTGHWIEETTPAQWEHKTAILGFTQVNNAHNGQQLGQALFKICRRIGILHKIGHVTCDNASNNSTMMEEFAARLKASTGKKYKWCKQKINCLAHVINLATQALIAIYSKSPHFDPKNPEAHIPTSRDEVGLVRAIVVKERSSSKCKQIWHMVQTKNKLKPLQLILDMKVRWSSTYLMLDQAERKKEVHTTSQVKP